MLGSVQFFQKKIQEITPNPYKSLKKTREATFQFGWNANFGSKCSLYFSIVSIELNFKSSVYFEYTSIIAWDTRFDTIIQIGMPQRLN